MITEIRLKKGSGVPSSLKYAEPAVDMLNKVLYIGMTEGEDGGSDFIKLLDETEVLKKIAEVNTNEEINSLKYYGDVNIVPSEENLFIFSSNVDKSIITVKGSSENISGNIVIPHKCTLDKKEYIINRIGEEAFFNCSNLTNVIIPNSIVRIRDNAFYNCQGLTKVIIPDSVIQIDDWAFEGCSLLKEVTFSENISTIALSAFKGCSSLTDVYYKGSPEDWNLVQIGSGNEALLNATIHYNWKNVTQGYVDENDNNIINMINNLHYYRNKDISYNKNLFTISSGVLHIDCSIIEEELVIPYTIGTHNTVSVVNPENITKIVIPRGTKLINNTEMMDEDLVSIFTNLQTIVRVHEDGAVLSYNIADGAMN